VIITLQLSQVFRWYVLFHLFLLCLCLRQVLQFVGVVDKQCYYWINSHCLMRKFGPVCTRLFSFLFWKEIHWDWSHSVLTTNLNLDSSLLASMYCKLMPVGILMAPIALHSAENCPLMGVLCYRADHLCVLLLNSIGTMSELWVFFSGLVLCYCVVHIHWMTVAFFFFFFLFMQFWLSWMTVLLIAGMSICQIFDY